MRSCHGNFLSPFTSESYTYMTGASVTHIELAAELVSAYVSRNSVPMAELPSFIQSVHTALDRLSSPVPAEAEAQSLVPAVPIRRSVQDEFIVCLEDGKKFKSMRRHLSTVFGLTPEEYRRKWGLPSTYPMVAPAYAKRRSALAMKAGLGRKTLTVPADETLSQSEAA